MAIKKYTNGLWVSASYRKYGTDNDTITTLPTTVTGDGTPISSYTIKGNMEQSGKPTPSNPIYPSECGERTENLFDKNNQTANKYVTSTGTLGNSGNHNASDYIEINPSTNYTLSNAQVVEESSVICNAFYDSNKTFISAFRNTDDPTTIMSPSNAKYVRITIRKTLKDIIMLTEGSTAPASYIPYGYKLPIISNSTVTNIYLGEVQSTRRIKKLVLTGEETWRLQSINSYGIANFFTNIPAEYFHPQYGLSSHLPVQFSLISDTETEGFLLSGIDTLYFRIDATRARSVDELKSFLAAQYAAGTPVTVWYVLKASTTGIVNEPLMKIGVYTDSVSGTGLTTSGTAQQFDVGTALKPSEVDMTYHGWHEHEDTKYST